MKPLLLSTLLAAALALAATTAYTQHEHAMPPATAPALAHHVNAWESIHDAVAVLQPTEGNTLTGLVRFTDTAEGLHIHADIKGLKPDSTHGFHIHEFGDASDPKGDSAGGHYNPEGHPHGSPDPATHHAGDLGNLKADVSGRAVLDLTLKDLTVAGLHNPIIGRSVVLHAGPDDLSSQPAGNSGPRLAVGIIGIARKPLAPTK